MRNYLRKVGLDRGSERYIRGKRVKDKGSIVSCLPLFSSVFLLNFFSFSLFYLKMKTILQTTKSHKLNNQYTLSFSLSFPKTLALLLKKPFQVKSLIPYLFFFGRPTYKSRISSSANTKHRAQFSKFCCICSVIWMSFTLWL